MRRWRSFLGVLAVCVVAAGAAACGDDDSDAAGSESSGAELRAPDNLVRDGTLSVCADLSFPPMSFEEPADKQPTGLDIDAARTVAELWGVELRVSNMPFDGVLPALASERCDVAWTGINVTPERLKSFGAIPYMETAEVIIVPDGNPDGIAGPDDLTGLTVATQSGTIYADKLKKLARELEEQGEKAPNIQTYPKMSDAIQQIVVGRADAVVTQDTEAAYRSSQLPGEFETAYTYPDALEFGVYFTRDNAVMKKALTTALDRLREDGTLAKIVEEYGLSPEKLVGS